MYKRQGFYYVAVCLTTLKEMVVEMRFLILIRNAGILKGFSVMVLLMVFSKRPLEMTVVLRGPNTVQWREVPYYRSDCGYDFVEEKFLETPS